MKTLLILFITLLSLETYATCTSPISRTNNGTNSVLTSTKYNLDLNTIYNKVNALPGDCLTDETITGAKLTATTVTAAKLAADSVTTVKILDGAVTAAKMATNPGKLLRITKFTSSGTWTKPSDVGSVLVKVIGKGGSGGAGSNSTGGPPTFSYGGGAGGGGGYCEKSINSATIGASEVVTIGTATSFGSHCVSNSGGNGSTTAYGIGGTATSGDITLQGNSATESMTGSVPFFGMFLKTFGFAGGFCTGGGTAGTANTGMGGVGGCGLGNAGGAGGSGLVIIYEYSN